MWGNSTYPKLALTDTLIKAKTHKDTDGKVKVAPYKLYDEKGLFLQVTANGGGKWWRLKYQFDGKEKLLSLGTYPEVPLAGRWQDPVTKKIWIDGARDKRDKARELIANEVDPSDTRKAQKKTKDGNLANSFEVVAREWLATKMQTKSERYQLNELRRFELYLFPWLGKRAISELNAPELLDVIRRIENQTKTKLKRPTEHLDELKAGAKVLAFKQA